MSKTDIEYGDRTWNVLTGCTVKSEGCKHCWAQKMAKRLKAMGRPEYQPCPGSWFMANVGKKAAGRLLDGKMWSEMPK